MFSARAITVTESLIYLPDISDSNMRIEFRDLPSFIRRRIVTSGLIPTFGAHA